MAQEQYLAGEVALWFQRDCGDSLEFLGCHNLTGVSEPLGDVNPVYCRVGKNQFEIQRTWRGSAGLGSATVVAYDTVLNYIRELACPLNLYVLHSACGVDEDPDNWDYIYIYEGLEPTSADTDTHVIGMTADEQTPIMMSMPSVFRQRIKVKQLTGQTVDVSDITTLDILSVTFCDAPQCSNLCLDASIGCQTGMFSTAGNGGSAVIGRTTDGGSSWSTIASPFTTATDDIHKIRCQEDLAIALDAVDTAYAYSWDGGATWTEVLTPTQIMNDVFILGGNRIWFVGQGGYIWLSTNKGASVTVQDAGAATAQNLMSVFAASSTLVYAVGASNTFLRTTDGGTIWSSVTGPATGIFPNDLYVVTAIPGTNIVLVGDEQGNVYRSEDRGDNWTTILTGYTNLAGGIYGIAAPNCNVLGVIGNDSDPYFYSDPSGYMYQSIDGGNSWSGVVLPGSNTGLRDIYACDVNQYWIGGDGGYLARVAGQIVTNLS